MTTEQTTESRTPIADNLRAFIIDGGTYDGKRGNTWTPTENSGYWQPRNPNRAGEPAYSITFSIYGDVVRGGEPYGYARPLEIRFSRFHHLYEGQELTHWSVMPPYHELPDTARKNIAALVDDRVGRMLAALGYGDGTNPAPVAALDDMHREACRDAAWRDIERAEDDAHRATQRADTLRDRLADPMFVPELSNR